MDIMAVLLIRKRGKDKFVMMIPDLSRSAESHPATFIFLAVIILTILYGSNAHLVDMLRINCLVSRGTSQHEHLMIVLLEGAMKCLGYRENEWDLMLLDPVSSVHDDGSMSTHLRRDRYIST